MAVTKKIVLIDPAASVVTTSTSALTINGTCSVGGNNTGDQILTGYQTIANLSNNIATDTASTTKYPSVNAIRAYVDSKVAGLIDFRGFHTGTAYPTTGGSGVSGAVVKGDMWIISTNCTIGTEPFNAGDSLIALQDTPAQTAGNWGRLQSNIGYTAENVAKKVQAISVSITDYPSCNAVKLVTDTKQATLVSGTNIKTVNGASLVGSGDVGITISTPIINTITTPCGGMGVGTASNWYKIASFIFNATAYASFTCRVFVLGRGNVSHELVLTGSYGATAGTYTPLAGRCFSQTHGASNVPISIGTDQDMFKLIALSTSEVALCYRRANSSSESNERIINRIDFWSGGTTSCSTPNTNLGTAEPTAVQSQLLTPDVVLLVP